MKAKVLLTLALFLATSGVETRSQEPMAEWKVRPGEPKCVFAPLKVYQTTNFRSIEKYYLWSLDSPVDAVLESVIREIARFELAQPGCCSDAIREKLEFLSVNGNSSCVRYKATLARMVMARPEMFASEGTVEYKTGEKLFTSIARRLEVELLAEKLPELVP